MPKQIQLIHPRSGKAPNLVLVEFMKDGRPELKIEDPLYVYGEDGNYTDEIKAIYAKFLSLPEAREEEFDFIEKILGSLEGNK